MTSGSNVFQGRAIRGRVVFVNRQHALVATRGCFLFVLENGGGLGQGHVKANALIPGGIIAVLDTFSPSRL